MMYAEPEWMPGPDYCYSCNRDEPLSGHDYQVCGECFHVYRTRLHLLWDHAKIVFGLCSWWRRIPWKLASAFIRPSRIFSCPRCAHDF